MHPIAAMLAKQPVFANLTEDQLARIADVGKRVVFASGETILEAGDVASVATLVISGDVEAHSQDGRVQQLATGALLADLAMIVDIEVMNTLRAATTVKALQVEQSAMRDVLAEDPDLAERLVAQMTAELQLAAQSMRAADKTFAETVDQIKAPSSRGG